MAVAAGGGGAAINPDSTKLDLKGVPGLKCAEHELKDWIYLEQESTRRRVQNTIPQPGTWAANTGQSVASLGTGFSLAGRAEMFVRRRVLRGRERMPASSGRVFAQIR